MELPADAGCRSRIANRLHSGIERRARIRPCTVSPEKKAGTGCTRDDWQRQARDGLRATVTAVALVECNESDDACSKQRDTQKHMKLAGVADILNGGARHCLCAARGEQLDFLFTGSSDRAAYLAFVLQINRRRGGAMHQKHRYRNEAQLHRAKLAVHGTGTRQKPVRT